jgi:hypothetical protein
MYFYTFARVLTLVCIPNLEELIEYILKFFLLVYIFNLKGRIQSEMNRSNLMWAQYSAVHLVGIPMSGQGE